jgi:hypothetical protein
MEGGEEGVQAGGDGGCEGGFTFLVSYGSVIMDKRSYLSLGFRIWRLAVVEWEAWIGI